MEAGHRDIKVAGEESKEDPLDFVLWKPKKEGEPSWPSPWSDGRPGWHIECSVMSKKYLGDEIDIHAGGEDLIFPHHENEIAQSEAANGCEFSKYWMHNGFLNINNKKMSKSLGNFFTVRDISEKYDLQVLRFFMLSAHYRSPLNFSDDLMESAKNGLERIITSGAKIRDIISNGKDGKVTDAEAKLLDEAKEYITKFEEAMDDDCNTANAISAVFELVKFANSNLNEGSTKEFAAGVYEILDKLCNVLGIILEKEEEKVGDEDYIEEMIAKRAQAKKDRDFAMADQIRDELAAKGIVLKDTREGTKWSISGNMEENKILGEHSDLFQIIKDTMELKDIDIINYSPLTLAYIGDGIYEIVIRTIIVDQANRQVNKIHKAASNLVKAHTQAEMIFAIMDKLTEQELAIYKRGRNAKAVTRAKNASMSDYRTATGFEALMGWLYLTNKSERMMLLIKEGLSIIEKEEDSK